MNRPMSISPTRAVRPELPATIRTTAGQDLTTAILASWMTMGGFVDGYAHRNLDTPETFFTPWHGVLYSGFLAVAGWLTWLVVRNRPHTPSLGAAIPAGYGTSVAGVLVFAGGGLGDMVWHTVFGIEVSIDALLSPTHLMLLVGALLILSGPLRSSWLHADAGPGRRLPALLALAMGAGELGFFFQYMDGTSVRLMQTVYVPGTEEGYFAVVAGFGSILVTTIILMGSLLLLMRRWALPPGAGLVLFGVFGLLMEVLEGFEFPEDLIAPLSAGLAVEVLRPILRPSAAPLSRLRVFVFAVPVVMWSVRFAVFELYSDINWPVAVWTGVIFFSGLTGVGLSLLFSPPDAARATGVKG
jgi:hypothetical protein